MIQRIISILTIGIILVVFNGSSSGVFAEPSDGYSTGDGIENSVTDGDTAASFEGLINWWKANSGIEMDAHEARNRECKKVVGLRFDFASNWDPVGVYVVEEDETEDAHIFYCAIDIHNEKITLNSKPDPDSVTDLYWSFQATVYYGCDIPTLALTPSPGSIDVGEASTVDIQIECFDAGGVGGMTLNLWLGEGSPGTLSQHEVITDGSGHASVVFHADGDGTAVVNAQVMACLGKENMELLEGNCQIDVGSRKLQVDLIYIGETHGELEFFSTFVHRMEIDIQTSDNGMVSGTGTGKTSFDFEYHNDEVHTENWESGGFTECEAEGTFDGEMYLINIDTTGSISYVHVVEIPGSDPIRIPIESDIDWDQLLAEPIEISAEDGATFNASGSFPWGLTYTILARWVTDESGE